MPFLDIFSKRKQKPKQIEKPKIIADIREKNSLVISELIEFGAEIQIQSLKVADYLVKDVAIERKTISDFLSSMINKRLTRQLEELQQYKKKLLIIEGIDEQELYQEISENEERKGINPNAIRGFLLHILLEYNVPIIYTKDYQDTAKFLLVIAKKQRHEISIRANKKAMSKKEQLQYILEGFPGIGPKTAKKLLKKFKTIKNITLADIETLKQEIGKKANIFKLLDEGY